MTKGSEDQVSEPNAFNKPLVDPPKKPAPPELWRVVRVFRKGDRDNSKKFTQEYIFKAFMAPPTHALFTSRRSLISPVSQKIGVPLLIFLEAPLESKYIHRHYNDYKNQMITDLLIQLDTGTPSPGYHSALGTAVVARQDYKPLSIGLLTTILAYVSMLLSKRYRSEDDSLVQYTITPEDFTAFARQFIDNTKNIFYKEWDIEL